MMECYECARAIPPGELYVSVDYHIERTEGQLVTVERA
jgi:hypothetical protein